MAIDNAEKRKAVSGIALQPWVAPGVTPNAAKDAQWRAQAAWSFSGGVTPPGGIGGTEMAISCGSLPSAGLSQQHVSVGGGSGIEG